MRVARLTTGAFFKNYVCIYAYLCFPLPRVSIFCVDETLDVILSQGSSIILYYDTAEMFFVVRLSDAPPCASLKVRTFWTKPCITVMVCARTSGSKRAAPYLHMYLCACGG